MNSMDTETDDQNHHCQYIEDSFNFHRKIVLKFLQNIKEEDTKELEEYYEQALCSNNDKCGNIIKHKIMLNYIDKVQELYTSQ